MVVWWVFFLSKLVNDKKILHMANPQGYFTPSFILYVNDIFVFFSEDNKSPRNLSIFLKYMEIFRFNMLIILRVFFSPYIILQDLSPKFNVFFFVVMVVYLLLIYGCLFLLALQSVDFFNLWLIKSN